MSQLGLSDLASHAVQFLPEVWLRLAVVQWTCKRGVVPKLQNISDSSVKPKGILLQGTLSDAVIHCWRKGQSCALPACPFPPLPAVPDLVFVGWVRAPCSCTNPPAYPKEEEEHPVGGGRLYLCQIKVTSSTNWKMCRILLSACKQKWQTIEDLSWEHCVTSQVSMLAVKGFEMRPFGF